MDTALIHTVEHSFTRRRLFAIAVPVVILTYLIYTAFAFDIFGVASRARMDNARFCRISGPTRCRSPAITARTRC
jgi:phosphonate transport system permease protein